MRADGHQRIQMSLRQLILILGLHQRYAYHKVKNEVAKQGFQLGEGQVEADGTIKLGVSRW